MAQKKNNISWPNVAAAITQVICTIYVTVLAHTFKVDMPDVVVNTATKDAASITVTAYPPLNNKTATLRNERPGLDAAVSRDRIDLLGKRVYVQCGDKSLGVREVVDVMPGHHKNKLDLMVPDKSTAKDFGKCEECKVMVIN